MELPILTEGHGRPDISFKGKLLYSDTTIAEKRAEEALSAPQTLYIVPSPLLFYGIDILLERLSEGSHILAIESNKYLYELSLPFFQSLDSSLITFIYTEDHFSSENIIKKLGPGRFRRAVFLRLNRGYMLNRKFYDSFFKNSETLINSFWKNRMTTIHMGRLWLKNIFSNLPFLSTSGDVSELQTDKSVFIAGAGESLENSISLIKKYRSLLFIIAADTAVPTLLDNEITPDLIIIVESQHANLYDFYNQRSLQIPSAFDLTSSPEVIRKHTGKKYFFISDFYSSAIFNKLDLAGLLPTVIPALGSVGIIAAYIALNITGKYVFYSGLDFSFNPEKFHSAGTASHTLSLINNNRLTSKGFFNNVYNSGRFLKIDKTGRNVYTDLIMLSYADKLNDLYKLSPRLFDTGISGIKTGIPVIQDDATFNSKLNSSAICKTWSLHSHDNFFEKQIFFF